jgi:prevent-host-death family protein
MRTVNVGTLKNELSAYLRYVRAGEEVIVRDRNTPVARIVPLANFESQDEEVERLVAAGVMTRSKNELEGKKMDWDAFWALPRPTVSNEALKEAIDWAKGKGDY